ncbi:MAG: GHKL domain-containing protein [Anaerotignum sp.]|nr:GHKL domain-containing protein [Anaerotignum sp.]
MNLSFISLHGIFLVFTLLSHIGASLFFAKPRFSKAVTAVIWLLYGVLFLFLFLFLPPETSTLKFFISFGVHLVLFFVTTTGRRPEKGFLFFSYACINTCFNTILNIVDYWIDSVSMKLLLYLCAMLLMQILLYAVLLPAFRKVTPYISTGWIDFYAVIIGFFVLIVAQSIFPALAPLTTKEIAVFLLTMVTFLITYTTVFTSMKNLMQLTQEKQKQLHSELLLLQVDSQAKEAEIVRQNRHDMRHHYQMLLSLAHNGDLDKITDYLERHTEYIEMSTTGRFCENETINNILKVYQQKAKLQNISMQIHAAAKPNLSAPSPDLVAIISNILENALHGAADSGSSKAFIQVTIKHKAQRFVVICDNSCASSLNFEDMPEHLRGIGIHSITSTADKYKGSCLFSAKDGVFHCMVIMDE